MGKILHAAAQAGEDWSMIRSTCYTGADRLMPVEVAARYLLADLVADWLMPAEIVALRGSLKQAYRAADAMRAIRKVSPPQI